MNEELYNLIENYIAPERAHSLVAEHASLNFAGPTGAGKGTLVTYLTQTGHYAPVVSDTTRSPRPHNDGFEVNGVSYWFISEDEAIQKVDSKAYIEVKAVHKKTMYGTSIAAYEKVVNAGRVPVLEIDVQGMEELMNKFPEFEAIFLLPPDFDTWQSRLDGRGRMHYAEKVERLRSACNEIDTMLNNPRFFALINTEVIDTAQLITSGEYKNDDYQQYAKDIAVTIRQQTQEFLATHSED